MKVRGQITIVDLNDARAIHASIYCNEPLVLVYDSGANSYTPDFTDPGNKAIFSPAIYVTGNQTNVADTAAVTVDKWFVDGVLVQAGDDMFTISGKTLVLSQNLQKSSYRIGYEATYTEPGTNLETPVSATTTISLIASGTPGVTYTIVVPEGPDFSTHGKSVIHAIPLFFKGGNRQNLTAEDTTWYKCMPSESDTNTTDGVNDGWEKITATSSGSGSNTAWVSTYDMDDTDPTIYPLVLYITPSAVDSFETFKCEVQDGETVYEEYIIVSDRTDAYQLEISSPQGDKILNGTGSADIYAKVYCNGNNVSDLFTYTWYFYDMNGTRITESGNPKTKSGTMTGSDDNRANMITLSHTEINRKITALCEATKK